MTRFDGLHDIREEILELFWIREERGEHDGRVPLEQFDSAEVQRECERLLDTGLLQRGSVGLALTPAGRGRARHVVRANRLAARLLSDLLELPPAVIELHACRLEHAIGPMLADRICSFLGHPPTAPDGRPIPPGACCGDTAEALRPAVVPLTELALGATGRVTFIRPRRRESIDQLSAMGLMPGIEVRLRQRRPSVVADIGETSLALDAEIARDIYVKAV